MSPVSEFFGWQSLGFGRLDCEGVRRTTRRWHWLQILRLILLHEIRFFCIIANNTSFFQHRAYTSVIRTLVKWTYHAQLIIYGRIIIISVWAQHKGRSPLHTKQDYPGRLLLQSAVSFCRPIKDVPIRTKSPLNFPSNFYS